MSHRFWRALLLAGAAVLSFTLGNAAPAAQAQTVMNIETALAKASLTNVQLRDPQANYHKLSAAQLKELTPDWSWETFFAAVNLPGLAETNIGQIAALRKSCGEIR